MKICSAVNLALSRNGSGYLENACTGRGTKWRWRDDACKQLHFLRRRGLIVSIFPKKPLCSRNVRRFRRSDELRAPKTAFERSPIWTHCRPPRVAPKTQNHRARGDSHKMHYGNSGSGRASSPRKISRRTGRASARRNPNPSFGLCRPPESPSPCPRCRDAPRACRCSRNVAGTAPR